MSAAIIHGTLSSPYQREVDAVVSALETDARRGLSEAEARSRLVRFGRNELTAEKPVPGWKKFLAQFKEVLVVLLLIATVISAGLWLVERESALPYEAIAIFAVVLLNAVMGYIQESRAESAVSALRKMSADAATVMRDGERRSIPAAEIVPGDIIFIEEGDTIPADARVIHSTALQTAEAALTGESLPISKDVAPVAGGDWTRRSAQHDLQWDGGDLRARQGCGHGDRDGDRNWTHRRYVESRAGGNHAAAKGTRSRR